MKKESKNNIYDLVLISVFAALIAVCAWITIPSVVPFTLQTFGIFSALLLLGGKRGTLSVTVYILLGVIGLPVFSGFKGGTGALLGPTGGYIIGFVFTALVFWAITRKRENSFVFNTLGCLAGLIVLYFFGTVWFVEVYSRKVEVVGYKAAVTMCVLPFIIPDIIKIALSLITVRLLSPVVKKRFQKP